MRSCTVRWSTLLVVSCLAAFVLYKAVRTNIRAQQKVDRSISRVKVSHQTLLSLAIEQDSLVSFTTSLFPSELTSKAIIPQPFLTSTAEPTKQRFANASDARPRPVTFITIVIPHDEGSFHANLGKSKLWIDRERLPHQWIVYNNTGNRSVSNIYAEQFQKARHNLVAFLHPDVFLPNFWYKEAMGKLAEIEAVDPNWGVLGTAGVALNWNPTAKAPRIRSTIRDYWTTYHTGKDGLEMQSFDEHFLMIRNNSGVNFDASLPGVDLYGSDIVMTARSKGLKSFLLNTRLWHKVFGQDGKYFKRLSHRKKVNSAVYRARTNLTRQYLRRKWKKSGFFPCYGVFFHLP